MNIRRCFAYVNVGWWLLYTGSMIANKGWVDKPNSDGILVVWLVSTVLTAVLLAEDREPK